MDDQQLEPLARSIRAVRHVGAEGGDQEATALLAQAWRQTLRVLSLPDTVSAEALVDALRGATKIGFEDTQMLSEAETLLAAGPMAMNLEPLSSERRAKHIEFLTQIVQSAGVNHRGSPLTMGLILGGISTLSLLLAIFWYLSVPKVDRRLPWRAQFYLNTELLGTPITLESTQRINYDWSERSPNGITEGDFSARFDSCLVLARETKLNFEFGSDDGSRLLVNGTTLAEMWQKQGYTKRTAEITLGAGAHHLELQYYQNGGASSLTLEILGTEVESGTVFALPLSFPHTSAPICRETKAKR